MARRICVALFLLFVVATPAQAQTGRILLDMTIQAVPGSPSGHCLYVDAGRIVVDARLVGDDRGPVRVTVGPAANVPASLDLRVTTPEPATATVQVEAGISCYEVTNEVASDPVGDNAPDEVPRQEQLVAVRLIWLPAPS